MLAQKSRPEGGVSKRICDARSGDEMDSGTMLERVGHEADFEQIKAQQFAPIFGLPKLARAIAKTEAVDLSAC